MPQAERYENYLPDPHRAVFLAGEINQALVDRLIPAIVLLRATSAPISVYIESAGGDVRCADKILDILGLRETNPERNRIITIASTEAASAAADILIAGDYVWAHPYSELLFHGSRLPAFETTSEHARRLMGNLESDSDEFASRLFEACEDRFYWQVAALQPTPDFTAWREAIRPILSEASGKVFDDSCLDMETFQSLLRKNAGASEGELIKRLIRQIPSSKLTRKVLLEKVSDAYGLEYFRRMETDVKTRPAYGHLVDLVDAATIHQANDGQLAEIGLNILEQTLHFGSFLLALARRLQRGENLIPPSDAVTLGLIDEVVGTNGFNRRRFVDHWRN